MQVSGEIQDYLDPQFPFFTLQVIGCSFSAPILRWHPSVKTSYSAS